MFGSNVLEVAIGIIFIYLLLSLICSVVNEWIAGVFALRAKNLAQGIKNLLQDKEGTGKAKDVYTHGLILGLSKTTQSKEPQSFSGKAGPSYIPARTF
nr:hypothetical protein [Nostoc sp. CHAB 5824]